MPIRRGEGLIYCQDRFIAYARYELGDLYRDDERPVYRGGRGTLRVVGHPFPVRLELGTKYTLRLARNEEWCSISRGYRPESTSTAIQSWQETESPRRLIALA